MLTNQVAKIRMFLLVTVFKVLAVAHRGCSEVEAERTLVEIESSRRVSSMASLRTPRSPTSSTTSPLSAARPSEAQSDSCTQSLVVDVCVRGPWERGAPNQVHNSDLKGLTCEMLCQQLTVQ